MYGGQENKSITENTVKTNRVKFLVEKTDESLLTDKYISNNITNNNNKNNLTKKSDSHLTNDVIWEFSDNSNIGGKFKVIF
jgi:hypothetical protein